MCLCASGGGAKGFSSSSGAAKSKKPQQSSMVDRCYTAVPDPWLKAARARCPDAVRARGTGALLRRGCRAGANPPRRTDAVELSEYSRAKAARERQSCEMRALKGTGTPEIARRRGSPRELGDTRMKTRLETTPPPTPRRRANSQDNLRSAGSRPRSRPWRGPRSARRSGRRRAPRLRRTNRRRWP